MKEHSLGKTAMAERLGMSGHSLVSTWTHPKNPGAPSAFYLAMLARDFDVPADWLLGITNDRNRPAAKLEPTLAQQIADYLAFRVGENLRERWAGVASENLIVNVEAVLEIVVKQATRDAELSLEAIAVLSQTRKAIDSTDWLRRVLGPVATSKADPLERDELYQLIQSHAQKIRQALETRIPREREPLVGISIENPTAIVDTRRRKSVKGELLPRPKNAKPRRNSGVKRGRNTS